MAAYVIFTKLRSKDEAELEEYMRLAPASARAGMMPLARYGKGRQELLEGPEHLGIVMIKFPSFEEAKAWYESPEYVRAREHRFKGADYQVTLVEGA